jgi:heat shock protein HtpX
MLAWAALPIAIAAIMLVVLSFQTSSRVIRCLEAEPLDGEKYAEVLASVRRYSGVARIPMPSIYWTRKNHVTTLSVGWSPRNSVVVLNPQIAEVLTAEELDSVVALEIAHIKFRDYLLRGAVIAAASLNYHVFGSISLQIVQTYQAIWSDIVSGRNPHILSDRRILYVLGIFVLPPLALLTLSVGVPIRMVVAQQEYRADAWSASVVSSPQLLANAIAKLANTARVSGMRLRDYSVLSVAASRPGGRIGRKLRLLLYPECKARIRMLGQYGE